MKKLSCKKHEKFPLGWAYAVSFEGACCEQTMCSLLDRPEQLYDKMVDAYMHFPFSSCFLLELPKESEHALVNEGAWEQSRNLPERKLESCLRSERSEHEAVILRAMEEKRKEVENTQDQINELDGARA